MSQGNIAYFNFGLDDLAFTLFQLVLISSEANKLGSCSVNAFRSVSDANFIHVAGTDEVKLVAKMKDIIVSKSAVFLLNTQGNGLHFVKLLEMFDNSQTFKLNFSIRQGKFLYELKSAHAFMPSKPHKEGSTDSLFVRVFMGGGSPTLDRKSVAQGKTRVEYF